MIYGQELKEIRENFISIRKGESPKHLTATRVMMGRGLINFKSSRKFFGGTYKLTRKGKRISKYI